MRVMGRLLTRDLLAGSESRLDTLGTSSDGGGVGLSEGGAEQRQQGEPGERPSSHPLTPVPATARPAMAMPRAMVTVLRLKCTVARWMRMRGYGVSLLVAVTKARSGGSTHSLLVGGLGWKGEVGRCG